MSSKALVSAALGLLVVSAIVCTASPARADVSEPSPGFVMLPALPGLVVGSGALVTTIGSAATQADGEPSSGWSVASIVAGALSVTSGAIYTGVVADGNAEPELFTSIAASNFALGASSLVLGIVGATTDASPTTMGMIPRLSVDAEGRRLAVVGGAF